MKDAYQILGPNKEDYLNLQMKNTWCQHIFPAWLQQPIFVGVLFISPLLPNQTWVQLPACSKVNLLTPGRGEGRCRLIARPSREYGQLMLKRPELPDGFQGKVFKDSVKERGVGCVISSWTFF